MSQAPHSGWNDLANRTASSKHTGTRAFQKLATTIKQRDHYQCQINVTGICTSYGDTVDHIIPISERPDLADEPTNLRAACRACNEHKGRAEDRRPSRRPSVQRQPERHPGLL
ncbi:HNH endonuclease [Mycolicibacterium sp. 050158]|uniref:HNH endonuclease n=1 Tax=Mycolicibacterium sp. 050158 TaxID=3090602 RepID=UPI00299D64CA|nr:HNH endonuclease [Mycolicibacterium sp. 050158]MDX1890115.1 HNH endonuclease [Mycolicibacterium sp. 050158]